MAQIAGVLFYARDYDSAIQQSRNIIEMDPLFSRAYHILSRAYLQKGMNEAGVAAAEKFDSMGPGTRPGLLGYAYAVSGHRDKAMKLVAEWEARAVKDPSFAFRIAQTYGALGDKDRAFEWLNKAYDDRNWMLTLKVRTELESLRSDPRFAVLLKKVGLADR